ncbi:MAG: acetate--CoA ligase family protein [Candidatus Kerfeldbacteria bacterium]|nr:acetate--CoA ligase family protein [Candidatus Kerfeldbacteria bacterium]
MHVLHFLLYPKSIAVIGASRTPGKLGHDVLLNVKQFGYTGAIYPVNPAATDIEGLHAWPSVTKIKKPIDVALIVVPREAVAGVLRDCGKKRIPFAIIITAGFKEIGEEGHAAEEALVKLAAKYHIRLVGPNCLGFINAHNRLNASFAAGIPAPGNISLVSQSGAMGVAMLDWAYESKLGFAKVLSIGNKADIDEIDCLDYLGQDKATNVIMFYLESLTSGRAFMEAASRIARRKPIIVLKAGTSLRAQMAVSSHTGSLAGSEEAIRTGLRQAGVIQAHTIQEFFDYALICSQAPQPKGNRVAIITNAGGPGIMAVDAAASTTLHLIQPSKTLQKKLAFHLPNSASVKNPIDVIGDATPQRFEYALKTALASREVDSVICILTPQVMTDDDTIAQSIIRLRQKYGKPVIASFMGGQAIHSGRMILETGGIPQYDTPERAVNALNILTQWSTHPAAPMRFSVPAKTHTVGKNGHALQLRTIDAEHILQRYHLPVLKSRLVKTERDCERLTHFPVVAKIASRDIVHKAAAGGIILNIQNVIEAKAAFRKITHHVAKTHHRAEVEGLLVQPQLISTHASREVIIGMKRDSSFGPMMMIGLGGSYVELMQDVAFAIAPVSRQQAHEMITQLRMSPLLKHHDIDALVHILMTAARIAIEYPEISEMDLNPVVVHGQGSGADILDVRMMI